MKQPKQIREIQKVEVDQIVAPLEELQVIFGHEWPVSQEDVNFAIGDVSANLVNHIAYYYNPFRQHLDGATLQNFYLSLAASRAEELVKEQHYSVEAAENYIGVVELRAQAAKLEKCPQSVLSQEDLAVIVGDVMRAIDTRHLPTDPAQGVYIDEEELSNLTPLMIADIIVARMSKQGVGPRIET